MPLILETGTEDIPAMQCNQSFCGTGLPNCGQFTNYSQIPNCSQFPNYCQYPNCNQAPNHGQFSPCNPALQCNGASYPEIVGEGEVISLMLPDGSMKLYFQPTLKWCGPFVQNPNDVRYNTAWFVRNISSLNSVNTFGNLVPQPAFNQSQSPYLGPPLQRPCFSCNSNIALPIQTVPPCQLKFHNDGWTSTTDLAYFYPRVRKSDVVSKSCAGVQVSSLTADAETYKPCHCDVVCPKPCDCQKTCYQEMDAAALSSSHGDTRSLNPFSGYDSKTREKYVTNSQSYMSIDEEKPKRKSSQKYNTKNEAIELRIDVCECSSDPQKGIVIASSRSSTSVADTKWEDSIDKKAKKENDKKEKRKKKEQSQESLCPCCSSTAASTSSLKSSEKKKLKLKKKEKKEWKDRKSSSQSESKDYRSDNKTEEPKKKKLKLEKKEKKERKRKLDSKCSSQSEEPLEEPKKMRLLDFSRSRTKHEKKSNEKKKGKENYELDKSIDNSLVCLCPCSSTATSSNSRTSNEKKHKPNREKKVKKDKKKSQYVQDSTRQSKSLEHDVCHDNLKKDTNEKKKQYILIDGSLVSLCSCCPTPTNRTNSRTSNEKKHRLKQENKAKKDKKIKHVHEHKSAGSNKPGRKIKTTKKTHAHEYHSSLESKESVHRMGNKASNSSLVKKAMKEKSSQKIKTKKKAKESREYVCECSSYPQKGTFIASSRSSTSVEDTKSKDRIDKNTKKEKVKKEKRIKKEQSQENLCPRCSLTAVSTSSLTSSEKKKLKLEKKEKEEKKSKHNRKSSSQSESKNGTYVKTEEPKKIKLEKKEKKERKIKLDCCTSKLECCKCSSQSASKDIQSDTETYIDVEEPMRMRLLDFSRSTLEEKTNEKKEKSIDESLVSLCQCSLSATSTNRRTPNEKKYKEKKVKKGKKSKHVHESTSQSETSLIVDTDSKLLEHSSAGSNKLKRKIKESKKTHVHKLHSSLELKESDFCKCSEASSSKQVASYTDQDRSYTDGIACGSESRCKKPIIENPMLKCFPEINNNYEIPCID